MRSAIWSTGSGFLLVTQGVMPGRRCARRARPRGFGRPLVLLALTFGVGTGQALTSPTWQTLQPELVPAADRQQAISLGSGEQNLPRAVGPAIAGPRPRGHQRGLGVPRECVVIPRGHRGLALVARHPIDRAPLPCEHFGEAIRAGGRFVLASPRFGSSFSGPPGSRPLRRRRLGAAAARREDRLAPGFGRIWTPAGLRRPWRGRRRGVTPSTHVDEAGCFLSGIGSPALAGVALVLGFVHAPRSSPASRASAVSAWI